MTTYPKTHTSALDVANYLVARAIRERRFVDPMSLQKILYYAQCWHLAEYRAPLFAETIEAWTWGPVVPLVWKAYSGRRPIVPDEVFFEELSASEQEVVDSVWLVYRDFNGPQLSRMTHREEPWLTAREDVPRNEKSNRRLDLDLMRKSAEDKLAKNNQWFCRQWDGVLQVAGAQ